MWNKFIMWQRKRVILIANGIYHEQWIVFLIVNFFFFFFFFFLFDWIVIRDFFYFSEYCFIWDFFFSLNTFPFFFFVFPLNTLKIGDCLLNTFIWDFCFSFSEYFYLGFCSIHFVCLLLLFVVVFDNIFCVIQLVVFSPLTFPLVDWALENN